MFASLRLDRLVRRLHGNDYRLRIPAAEALAKLGDPRAVAPLLGVLGGQYTDRELRAAAGKALGELGDARAVDPLTKALTHREGAARKAAALALGKLGDTTAVEPLIDRLGDREGDVRRAAAEALAELGSPEWTEWVKGDYGDSDRCRASGHPRAADVLAEEWIRRLEHGSRAARKEAAGTLAAILRRRPTALTPARWREVWAKARCEHTDTRRQHNDAFARSGVSGAYSSNDCMHSETTTGEHTDRGGVVDFPDPPAEGTDF